MDPNRSTKENCYKTFHSFKTTIDLGAGTAHEHPFAPDGTKPGGRGLAKT